MPVLIIASYDKNGTVDAMNAAWGGIGDYEQISMCLSKGHKTVKNILERKAFTVSVATAKYVKECDYLGLVSANDNPDQICKIRIHGYAQRKSKRSRHQRIAICNRVRAYRL